MRLLMNPSPRADLQPWPGSPTRDLVAAPAEFMPATCKLPGVLCYGIMHAVYLVTTHIFLQPKIGEEGSGLILIAKPTFAGFTPRLWFQLTRQEAVDLFLAAVGSGRVMDCAEAPGAELTTWPNTSAGR